MAFGVAEDPGQNPTEHLDNAEYPVWREQLVKLAADNGGSVDVINLLKSLPQNRYESKVQVQRDLAEAARRMASGIMPHTEEDDGAVRDRRNIGRDAVEGASDSNSRHP